MGKEIPVIPCIDVEPDLRQLRPRQPIDWKGFERTHEISRRWRFEWEQVTGAPARFSWFFRMDPQVEQVYGSATWVVDRYPEIVAELRRLGDEMGLHVHYYRWEAALDGWVIDHGNPPWVRHCVDFSLSAFQRAFGHACRSFRNGDAFICQEVVSLLEQAGVRFDLSLEPGQESYRGLRRGETNSGRMPDLRDVPRRPYRPRGDDFKTADPDRKEGICLIPVSRGEVSGLHALAFKLFRRWVNGIRLNRAWITLYFFQEPSLFRRAVDRLLAVEEPGYLALLSHSQAVLRPYFFRNMKKNLNYLLSHPRAKDFVLATPQQAMASLGLIQSH